MVGLTHLKTTSRSWNLTLHRLVDGAAGLGYLLALVAIYLAHHYGVIGEPDLRDLLLLGSLCAGLLLACIL